MEDAENTQLITNICKHRLLHIIQLKISLRFERNYGYYFSSDPWIGLFGGEKSPEYSPTCELRNLPDFRTYFLFLSRAAVSI
jgi:hypothetical protein